MTFDDVREIALGLPEVEEGTWFRTPCLRVRTKSFARLKEDDETLVVWVDPLEREALLAERGDVYFITPHYRDHPYVLVRLPVADPVELRELLVEAWLASAPKRLAAEHEERLLG